MRADITAPQNAIDVRQNWVSIAEEEAVLSIRTEPFYLFVLKPPEGADKKEKSL